MQGTEWKRCEKHRNDYKGECQFCVGQEMEGKHRDGSAIASPALRALERSNVVFFLLVQQMATIRDFLASEGYPDGPGTSIGLLAHMKKEVQEQSAENRAILQAGG